MAAPVHLGAAAQPFPVIWLTEQNYFAWSMRMEAYLQREELWDIVALPPVNYDDDGERRLYSRAHVAIIMALDDAQLVSIGAASHGVCMCGTPWFRE